jgi:hypothetical protein
MEIIRGYRITTSSSSKKQQGSVTVRTPEGAICAKLHSPYTKPINRVRNNLLSEERATLISQLRQCAIPEEDILAIVAIQPKG